MEPLGRHHPTLRRLRRLRRDRDARDREGVFLAEGVHLALDAVRAGADVERALVSEGIARHADGTAVLSALRAAGVEPETTSDAALGGVQDARAAQPVLLVVRRGDAALEPRVARLGRDPLVVVACGLQDPGNLGTVLRTADAAGADLVVVAGEAVDPWHPRAVRATAGAIFRIAVARVRDAAGALDRLAVAGLRAVGADPHAGEPYDRFDWGPGIALVLGAEGGGLDAEVRRRLAARVSIPMRAGVESLSVGAAAAVLLFAAARARGVSGSGGG